MSRSPERMAGFRVSAFSAGGENWRQADTQKEARECPQWRSSRRGRATVAVRGGLRPPQTASSHASGFPGKQALSGLMSLRTLAAAALAALFSVTAAFADVLV